MARNELSIPELFDPKHAALWAYRSDDHRLFLEAVAARKRLGLKPSSAMAARVHLLLIDMQRDFCHPEGTLYVGGRSGKGAIDDSRRVAEFIYRNADVLTNVTTTLDTHFAFQIFFAPFWETEDGKPLSPHTMIDVDPDGRLVNKDPAGNILAKNIRPNPAVAQLACGGDYAWLLHQVRFYCEKLREGGKYTLYLWPPHCLLGSVGHALVGVTHEARMFHAFLRVAQSGCEVKGGHVLTENYSVFRPEVLERWDRQPLAQKNAKFLKLLLESDVVVIAGQAASHCVRSSIDDLLDEIMAQDVALARKVYIMEDCMSAVAVPDGKGGFIADFTPQAEAALVRFRAAGMHVVRSTDPITSWDGLAALAA